MAARELVAGAHPRVDAIDHTDSRALRGDEAARLRHDDGEGGLPHCRRLAGHVGAGEQHEASVLGVEGDRVGNETVPGGVALDRRVPAVLEPEVEAGVDARAYVAAGMGDLGQRGRPRRCRQASARDGEVSAPPRRRPSGGLGTRRSRALGSVRRRGGCGPGARQARP